MTKVVDADWAIGIDLLKFLSTKSPKWDAFTTAVALDGLSALLQLEWTYHLFRAESMPSCRLFSCYWAS